MPRVINPNTCVACGACFGECPVDAIIDDYVCRIDANECIDCGACEATCPFNAIYEVDDDCGPIHSQPTSYSTTDSGSTLTTSSEELEYTEEEQLYLEEYKEMLADYGTIGPRERKQLEKARIRLGLSESKVDEIEKSICSGSELEVEQEYLELFTELMEDYGSIGGPQRKQLERARIRLNISEERAKQIESYI